MISALLAERRPAENCCFGAKMNSNRQPDRPPNPGPRRPALWPLTYIPVPWTFVLGYVLGVGLEHFLPSRSSWSDSRIGTVGLVLFAIGAALAGWGWVIFQKAHTTRVPGEASTAMVTWGPYKFTRNPMYVGLTLAYLGEAGILHQLWPVGLLPLVLAYLNWTIIPIEERQLQKVFGTRYDEYRSRVRRWL